MLERELKFHVPARQRAGLKARMRKLGADTIELHAHYFDTEDQALARARIALRVRREGDSWVQTIKTPGPDELSRIEWNHPRPGPTLDVSIYADTHIGPLLSAIAARLRCRYVTQVTRLKHVVSTGSGAAELAYDEGAILAGDLGLPVHELEIEGISGEAADLFSLARGWLQEHRLILDLRSKAARGDALAACANDDTLHVRSAMVPLALQAPRRLPKLAPGHIQRLAAPVRASQLSLAADIGIRAAYLECANDCMNQIIRNATFLAGVDGIKTTPEQRIEYVHQIRVGIRRLRACWKLFGDAACPPEDLVHALRQYFGILGQARDQDVIQTELLPRLIQAGMPPDTTEAIHHPSDEQAVRMHVASTPEFQMALFDLLEHLVLYGDALQTAGAGKPAAAQLARRLNAWLDAIRRDIPRFAEATWNERHDMRKHVKRLRYGMEFAQGALHSGRIAPLRTALVSAQKALGQLNDLHVAAEYYRGPGARHPSAMFALGWLAATQQHETNASLLALESLGRAGRFQPAGGRSGRRSERKKARQA